MTVDPSDQLLRAMRISRRRMLVLTSVATATGVLAAARAASADTPAPAALQPTAEPGLATLSTMTPAPTLAALSTPTAAATPASVANGAPQPTTASLLASAAALGLDPSKVILPQQYPTWNDGAGWSQPSQYKTIQLADIDGDGRAELIGRGTKGLQVYRWNTTYGIWDAVSVEGPLTDADGWNEEKYYLTIQCADVDGDGRAELMARGRDGVMTFRWDGTGWTSPTGGGPLPDADGWGDPKYYSTIQLADIDGDKKAEMIARGREGVTTLRWHGKGWTSLTGRGPLPEADGWGDPKYYSTIELADIDGDGQAELIARGPNGVATLRWDTKQDLWGSLAEAGPLPDVDGWDKPQYYTTIQLADVNGDGKAELIARGRHGVTVLQWDGRQWTQLAWAGPLADVDGWDKPQYYTTIQLADVDGNGKAELIARGPKGVLAWSWMPTLLGPTGSWTQMAGSPGVMADPDGWGEPPSYLTFQAADVDGDGKFEILGRGSDGIQTWKWAGDAGARAPLPDANASALTMAGIIPATSDEPAPTASATGTNPPLSEVTPAPTATNPPLSALTPVPTATNPPLAPLTEAPTAASATPTPASTPTVAPTDTLSPTPTPMQGATPTPTATGEPSQVITLVAPTPVIGFRTSVANGFYQPSQPGFPDYRNTPGQLRSYQLISQYLLGDGPGSAWPPEPSDPSDPRLQDIRAQYINTLVKNWLTFASAVAQLKGKAPACVPKDDFETVRQQLQTELKFVDHAYIWFGNTKTLLTELFDENAMSVPIVAGHLALSESSDASVILNWLSLALAIEGAILALAITVGSGGILAPIVGGILALESMAFRLAAGAVGGTSIKTQVLHLQEQLLANRERALASNDLVQIAYLKHWGLLKALGEPIESLDLTWPVDLTNRAAAQGQRGYELTLWQTLSPIVWFVAGYRHRGGEKYAYHYTGHLSCSAEDWLFVQKGEYKDVDDASLARLFEKPTNGPNGDPSGPLGVPLQDIFLSRNGWHLDGYLTQGCNFEPPVDPSSLRRHRTNPKPRRK
jgi:hypothetical protein